ncbi:hypothetical protein ABT063_46380 [Streptomyces sp. NPDC002838]|uniref:hypothetical protein n=1 Tax=Streptomyces sp. NPDC002838 TaxID=3154436 RepID=UPI003322C51D
MVERFGEWSMYRFLSEHARLDPNTIDLLGTLENLTSRLPLAFPHSFMGSALIPPAPASTRSTAAPPAWPTPCWPGCTIESAIIAPTRTNAVRRLRGRHGEVGSWKGPSNVVAKGCQRHVGAPPALLPERCSDRSRVRRGGG